MTRPVCCRNVTKESFLLSHSTKEDFLLPWWSENVLWYAIWSSFCSVYCVSMIVYSGLCSEHGVKILIWLTYWSFYCLTLRFILNAVNCWYYVCCSNEKLKEASGQCSKNEDVEGMCMQCCIIQHDQSRKELKEKNSECLNSTNVYIEKKCQTSIALQWLLQNISNVSSVMVTIMFWTVVYTGNTQTFVSINSHILNSILVLVDIMISRAPVRIQHVYMPLVYNLIYVLFTMIYWLAGGTNQKGEPYIYKILDYSNTPGKAAMAIVLVCLIALPMTHIGLWGLFKLRQAIHKHYNTRQCKRHNGMKVVFSHTCTTKESGSVIKCHELTKLNQ
ncbi:hypothetical protein Btru_027520 [Bulinus truncatus]|nr:hypothetical protein Btru_027520 [Bulinus truncatus]